jgi:hypothetical protein
VVFIFENRSFLQHVMSRFSAGEICSTNKDGPHYHKKGSEKARS